MIFIGMGIISLIFLIFQMVVLAIAIDIGTPAIDRPATMSPLTRIITENLANETGKITSVEIWALTNLTDCEVATFYAVDETHYTTRDYETIGTVTAGSKQTFAVNLDVEKNDVIGIYYSGGALAGTTDIGNTRYATGDNIPCTNQYFTFSTYQVSLYGTGTTEVAVKKKNVIFMGSNF